MTQKAKTTMSVHEMRDLLGIGKTESYWLVKKRLFQVETINNKMRIVLSSFEAWYDHQTRYRKITGQEPGSKLRSESLSVHEIAELLELSVDSSYELIRRAQLTTITVHNRMRVPRVDFMAWYAGQTRYRLPEDRKRDRDMEDNSLSLPEVAKLLEVSRNDAYSIVQRAAEQLEIITIADRKRITKESFGRWFANEYMYNDITECLDTDMKKRKVQAKRQRKRVQPKEIEAPMKKDIYTLREAAYLLKMEEREVYRLIENEQLRARKVVGKWRITHQAIQQKLNEQARANVEGGN